MLLVALAATMLLGGPVVPAHADPVTALPPGVWPVAGSPTVLRAFDPPTDPWDAAHRGVDLALDVGDGVRSSAAGTVTYAGMIAGRGVVVVDHGSVRATYEPVRAEVSLGEQVSTGQRLGVLSTGAGAGHCAGQSCLHWGLRQGESYLDPLLLLASGVPPDAGPVRLLGQDAVAAARRRAAVRAVTRATQAAASAAALADPGGVTGLVATGPGGDHGFVLPASGPISSGFGIRLHPVLHVWKLHDGADLAAPCGAPLRAPADGVVIARYANAGYGNRLLIDHGVVGGRHVVTALNHASGYRVGLGDRVQQGESVGTVGQTGYATGCHLHLMVWLDGRLVDPMTWF